MKKHDDTNPKKKLNHYENKKQAAKLIEKMVTQDYSYGQIMRAVILNHGLGARFVDDYLILLESDLPPKQPPNQKRELK